jgi:hypothetical protein
VDSSFLCYNLQWRILRWVCLLLLIALTTLLFTSLCYGLQVMCISFSFSGLQVMRYAQFWSNDSFLHSKASPLFFSPFQMILSLMPRLQVLCLADRYHSQWVYAAFKFAMRLYFFPVSSSAHLCYWILFLQDIQSTTDLKSSAQGTNEVQSQQPNPMSPDAPPGDSGSLSAVNNDNKKVSREDIELVRFKLS